MAWGVVMMLERHKRGGKVCKAKMEGGQVKETSVEDQVERQSSPRLWRQVAGAEGRCDLAVISCTRPQGKGEESLLNPGTGQV